MSAVRRREVLLKLQHDLLHRARVAGFGDADIAAALDIRPVVVEVLLAARWTFEEAFAFAEAVGLKIEIVVS